MNVTEPSNPGSSVKKLHVKTTLIEAWHLTYGLKWLVLKRALLLSLLSGFIVLSSFIILSFVIPHLIRPGMSRSAIIFFTLFPLLLINMKFWVPILMIGVRQAIGLSVDLKLINLGCSSVKYELWTLIFFYGFILSVLICFFATFPSQESYGLAYRFVRHAILFIVFIPITVFAFPLLILQRLTAYSALKRAYQTMYTHWKVVTGCYLVIYIPIYSMLGILFGIGLFHPFVENYITPLLELILSVWLLPLMITIGGILFRDVYGLKRKNADVL